MATVPGIPVVAGVEYSAFWRWKVRRVQWRMNVGWWLESMLPLVFLGCVLMTALVLAGRRAGWSTQTLLIVGAAVACGVVAASLVRASRRFISFAAAQAKLEDMLVLHNRLSAAAAGVGAWPPREAWRSGNWPWNWRRLGVLPTAGVCLLLAAVLIPISAQRSIALAPTAKPPALETVEEWLAELEKNEAVQPESLEPAQQQAQELARQDPKEWYSHASLEAADHLRAKLQTGLQSMAQNAGKLDTMLGEEPGQMSEAEATMWNQQMQSALASLEGNLPSLSRDLASQLRQMDASKLGKLSPEQLEALRKRLQEAQGTCKACLGTLPCEGEGKEGPGRGGVQRGPGTAPLTFEPDATDLQTKKTEALESTDYRDAALGDRLGMSDAQPEVDPSVEVKTGPGGSIGSAGAGADAVWLQQNVSPEERRRLRTFFQ